ncbi:hypothetical protein RJT34_11124 [Clitoria ternatea]|uniref:PGG domain-containing protein n=1 Tax=Clitoria ternatea TaxID=43366 RepID=A0AAN9JJG8_CLITE
MLARMPTMDEKGLLLLTKIWYLLRNLKSEQFLDLIKAPSIVLFDAIKSGNVEAVDCLLQKNQELLTIIKDTEERNALHFAALHRQKKMLRLMLKMRTVKLIIREVDIYGNNVLHIVASSQAQAPSQTQASFPDQKQEETEASSTDQRTKETEASSTDPKKNEPQASSTDPKKREIQASSTDQKQKETPSPTQAPSSSRIFIQIRDELGWFAEVSKNEDVYNSELRKMRNLESKTPKEVFSDSHGGLHKQVKKSCDLIATGRMIVGGLSITVSFAAALIDFSDDHRSCRAWFVVFILANAVAMLTSVISIFMFFRLFDI